MPSTRFWLQLAALLLIASSTSAQGETTVFDKDVKVVEYKEMHYPMGASLQGIVVMRLKLDGKGSVTDAIALSGEPLLIQASVANAKAWRFEPNSQKTAILVYQFRIEGLCDYENAVTLMSFYPPNFVVVRTCGRPAVP